LLHLNDVIGAVAHPTFAYRHGGRIGLPRQLILAVGAICAVQPSAAFAASNNEVRISGLSDLAFGSITNLNADNVLSESLCLYAKAKPTDLYRITATGSGAGGSFSLNSGSATLAYDVQWSASPNQASGIQLAANQPLTAQPNGASDSGCTSGSPTTASLIVILRSSALAAATSGTYSGTLTLLVAPE